MTDQDLQGTHTRSEVLEMAREMREEYRSALKFKEEKVSGYNRVSKERTRAKVEALDELIQHYEGE